jgi:hypothetical protein
VTVVIAMSLCPACSPIFATVLADVVGCSRPSCTTKWPSGNLTLDQSASIVPVGLLLKPEHLCKMSGRRGPRNLLEKLVKRWQALGNSI